MKRNRLPDYLSASESQGAISDSLEAGLQTIRPTLNKMSNVVTDIIRKQPLATITVGVTVGVILGCLIKRR